MNVFRNLSFLLGILSISLAASLAQGPALSEADAAEKRIVEELTLVEKARVQAMLSSDSGAIDRIFADNYIQVTSYGEIRNRNHIINALKSKALKYDAIENSDHRFNILGDTAVVTGHARRKGREKDRDLSGEFRFIRTWVKHDGKWLLLAQQSTLLPKGSGSK